MEIPVRQWGQRRHVYDTEGFDTFKNLTLTAFTYEDAYNLGTLTRKIAMESITRTEYSVVVDISTPEGHCLYRCAASPSTSAINDWSIEVNRKAAIFYKCPSYFLQDTLVSKFKIRESYSDSHGKQLSFHQDDKVITGGAIPIYLRGSEFPVACLTVDGYKSRGDHLIAFRSLEQFAKAQEAEQQKITDEKREEEQEKLEELVASRVSERLKEINSVQKMEGGAWQLFESHA